jgi:hypothetical protein
VGSVKKVYASKQRPVPPTKSYTSTDPATSNGFGFKGHDGGIPVLVTTLTLLPNMNAWTVPRKGTIIKTRGSDSDLAHELGHFVGYTPGPNGAPNGSVDGWPHSPNPSNVMFGQDTGGTDADPDYCKKVTSLAK